MTFPPNPTLYNFNALCSMRLACWSCCGSLCFARFCAACSAGLPPRVLAAFSGGPWGPPIPPQSPSPPHTFDALRVASCVTPRLGPPLPLPGSLRRAAWIRAGGSAGSFSAARRGPWAVTAPAAGVLGHEKGHQITQLHSCIAIQTKNLILRALLAIF